MHLNLDSAMRMKRDEKLKLRNGGDMFQRLKTVRQNLRPWKRFKVNFTVNIKFTTEMYYFSASCALHAVQVESRIDDQITLVAASNSPKQVVESF